MIIIVIINDNKNNNNNMLMNQMNNNNDNNTEEIKEFIVSKAYSSKFMDIMIELLEIAPKNWYRFTFYFKVFRICKSWCRTKKLYD